PSLRHRALLSAADDERVAIVLLDVILGFGAHTDPAGLLAPVVVEAIERAARTGRQLSVLAHVVGTAADPQRLAGQEEVLRRAGVQLFGSNYHAAVAAGLAVEQANA